jgi:hypothetical protein
MRFMCRLQLPNVEEIHHCRVAWRTPCVLAAANAQKLYHPRVVWCIIIHVIHRFRG